MKMSKIVYFSEFLLFPPLILIAVLLGLRYSTPPRLSVCLTAYGVGLVVWTLIEYVFHRALFHHAPFLSRIHDLHHQAPKELIGTPGWLAVLAVFAGLAGPLWLAIGFNLGTAVVAGFLTGYLWYVFVHYATHHWQPRRNSYLYRARLRHSRHHYLSQEGNFGVTTAFWDRVFGTALEERASTLRAVSPETPPAPSAGGRP
jgi:sterol desaturase/sphingolipid hydroxylase (fatty acid hydroxylase superfamily)